MKRVTVFCGSSFGTDEIYKEKAYLLGQYLAKKNIEVVYGGASVGLMGAIADGALSVGGKVLGVVPEFIKEKGIVHKNLTKLYITKTMHERKIKMNELSDGVIALPGGYGTLEEFFEMLTWAQLGLHKKPIAILNVNGFYNPLKTFIKTMVDKGFLKKANKEMLLISENINELLNKMENYKATKVEKWITKLVVSC